MVNQQDFSLYPARGELSYANGGVLISSSESDFLTKFPRVQASITLTVGGSITNGDTITVNLVLALLSGGKIAKTISITGSDTVISVAQKIAQAFADDATLQSYGGTAYSLGAVVTIKFPGLLGNVCTLTKTLSGGATATGTISNSGAFSGGSGPVIPFKTFSLSHAGQTIPFEAGKPANVNAGIVKTLVAAGSPVY